MSFFKKNKLCGYLALFFLFYRKYANLCDTRRPITTAQVVRTFAQTCIKVSFRFIFAEVRMLFDKTNYDVLQLVNLFNFIFYRACAMALSFVCSRLPGTCTLSVTSSRRR